jgi:hypothetical protein
MVVLIMVAVNAPLVSILLLVLRVVLLVCLELPVPRRSRIVLVSLVTPEHG